MSFTKNSEKLIKEFIGEFEKYCKKKTKATQRRTDNILKTVYNDIRLSSNFVELLDEKNLLKIDTKQIKSLHELPKTQLMDSQFMPGSIKDDILYNILGFMKLNTIISGIKINIYYGIFKKSDFTRLSKVKARLKDALRYVKFCCSNATLKSIKTLDIYLYLTNEENTFIVLLSILFVCSKWSG